MSQAFETHLQEIRCGTVVLACLKLLHTPGYGYGLLQDLTTAGFETEANTLYPLLRRLEKKGHLTSSWNTDDSRPRKFYQTSQAGKQLAEVLHQEWLRLTEAIAALPDQSPGT